MPKESTEYLVEKFEINYQHLVSKEQIILATAYLLYTGNIIVQVEVLIV